MGTMRPAVLRSPTLLLPPMTTTTTKLPVLEPRRATVLPLPQSMRPLTLLMMPTEPHHQLMSTEHPPPLTTALAQVMALEITTTRPPVLTRATALPLRKPTVPQLRLMMLTEPPPPTKRRRLPSDAAVVDSVEGDLPPGGPPPGGPLPRALPLTGDQPRLAVLAG